MPTSIHTTAAAAWAGWRDQPSTATFTRPCTQPGDVAAAILERGGTPFLHVAVSNEPARRLYDHLGFTERRLIEFVVLSPPGSG